MKFMVFGADLFFGPFPFLRALQKPINLVLFLSSNEKKKEEIRNYVPQDLSKNMGDRFLLILGPF